MKVAAALLALLVFFFLLFAPFAATMAVATVLGVYMLWGGACLLLEVFAS